MDERRTTMSRRKASEAKNDLKAITTTPSASKAGRKSKAKSDTKALSKFDISKLTPALRKSPIKLRDWLDLHIPWFIGPRVDALEPAGGQRGTIVTVHGARFAANRTDNEVTINGTPVPVLAASSNALKVLAAKDVDSGAVQVKVGTRTATSPYAFTVKGYPGAGDDGPPVFATGAGNGAAGDVNPIGTIRVMVVLCQASDRIPASLATVRTALTN